MPPLAIASHLPPSLALGSILLFLFFPARRRRRRRRNIRNVRERAHSARRAQVEAGGGGGETCAKLTRAPTRFLERISTPLHGAAFYALWLQSSEMLQDPHNFRVHAGLGAISEMALGNSNQTTILLFHHNINLFPTDFRIVSHTHARYSLFSFPFLYQSVRPPFGAIL